MDEKVKNKDAEPANVQNKDSDLQDGLEESFPGSDPVSATQPGHTEAEPAAKSSQ